MGSAATFDVRDRVGWITFARGDTGNTIGVEMVSEFADAVAAAESANVGVVVIAGAGRFFCLGGDLREFAEAASTSDLTAQLAGSLATVVGQVADLPAVVVAAVQGAAAGAGVAIAAAADVVLATESATFTLAYTRAGLSPDGGATLVTRTIGLHRTLAWALLNPTISAREAMHAGLVAQVHPDSEFDACVADLAARLSRGSRDAQVATKRLVRRAAAAPEEHWQLEIDQISALSESPDGQEGISAFLGKRPAAFPSAGGEVL